MATTYVVLKSLVTLMIIEGLPIVSLCCFCSNRLNIACAIIHSPSLRRWQPKLAASHFIEVDQRVSWLVFGMGGPPDKTKRYKPVSI
jgi:hypothetical protein